MFHYTLSNIHTKEGTFVYSTIKVATVTQPEEHIYTKRYKQKSKRDNVKTNINQQINIIGILILEARYKKPIKSVHASLCNYHSDIFTK